MLLLYLALALVGVWMTATLMRRRRGVYTDAAALGTLLAAFAIVGGFSIGPFVAVPAAIALAVGALGLRDRGSRAAG